MPYFKLRVTGNLTPYDVDQWFDIYEEKILGQTAYRGVQILLILWDQSYRMPWVRQKVRQMHIERGIKVEMVSHSLDYDSEDGDGRKLGGRDLDLSSVSKKNSKNSRHRRH